MLSLETRILRSSLQIRVFEALYTGSLQRLGLTRTDLEHSPESEGFG